VANALVWADVAASPPIFATVGFFGSNNAAEGLSAPVAVAVQLGGHLVILDAGNGELDRYQLSSAGGSYSYDGAFLGGNRSVFDGSPLSQPTALAIQGSQLFILDGGTGRVVRVDLGTNVATTIVTASDWSQPSGIAVDGNGNIFVADTFNHRLLKYAPGLSAPQVIAGQGTAMGKLRNPRGLAIDGAGNLFVADSGNKRVQVFDPLGGILGEIGSGSILGSIRGLTFDSAGNLYISDATRQAIHVFGAAAAGPILRIETAVCEFGSVGIGYALDRALVLHNDGSAVLDVTNATVDNVVFSTVQTQLQVPAGGVSSLIARFSPTAPGFHTGILTLTSNSGSGSIAGIVVRGSGITPALVDACLVLDRSGSMTQSIGSQTKMSALKTAAKLFVDLARADRGDRIGVADFDDIATLDLALTPITDASPSSRGAAKGAIDALNPRGATSIGGGMEQARSAFIMAGSAARKALVVATDGMENTAPFVGGGQPSDPHVDLTQYSGITIYTVGLGLGSEVDLGVLASLASTFRGSFYLTEDRWLTLSKFFIEIFCDTIDEFVTLDPEFELVGTDPWEIDLDLGTPDHSVTVAVYWQDPAVALQLHLITPDGIVLTGTSPAIDPRIRFVQAPGYAFFRFPLPLATAFKRAWVGTWRIRVSAALPAGTRMSFGVSAIVASSLGITCDLQREGDSTGQAPSLEVCVRENGRLVRPDAISFQLEVPVYSRGELLTMVGQPPSLKVSPDYGDPTIRKRLAWAVVNDPRFRERQVRELDLTIENTAVGPVMRANLPACIVEGVYHCRTVVHCRRGALSLRRECAHSYIAIAYPNPGQSEVTVKPKGEPNSYIVNIVPRDALGNRLGPGLASQMSVEVDGGRVDSVQDLGNGSYELNLIVRRAAEVRLTLSVRLRGVTMQWDWKELLGGRGRPDARSAPPLTTPSG
jgi:DNA-binding beta-propeller fold protein YncE